jgi:glycosyltransferase involved in cell wall biosynthesis
LDELQGQIQLVLVGGPTLWSDYRPLLAGLNPRTAVYLGQLSPEQVREELLKADLFLQPSSYEPFGLSAAEALASGVPVLSSDQVGATEQVSRSCCWRFPIEDLGAMEEAVREAVEVVRSPQGENQRKCARSEAERLFSPRFVASSVANALGAVSRASSGHHC